MPRISLRAYEKQIEEMIEQNRLQEAVAHCKQILKTFPKCISTYRILGKAFLEGKDYNEAADVFKRVLAVFPDDFISHVGMSIVRENENNLDAAIWHMELAFDSQPSNITIQEELKRLFGRRDGTHPAKIRLTRGALVRMYARGELYPQAIAEIKSALVEDPKRLDLKVLLAKMNYLLGDNAESLNLCNQLITELPYCYEINKLLVTLLPNSNKSEKLSIYLDRLKALNPYEEFVDSGGTSEADVPDERVQVESLGTMEPAADYENPDWVKTMDSKWEEPTNPESLDWLPQANTFAGTRAEQAVPSYNSNEQPGEPIPAPKAEEAENPEEEQLPDWMRTAGWLPTNEAAKTPESSGNAFMDETPAASAESAEVPDWLKSLAPEEPEGQNISEAATIPASVESSPFSGVIEEPLSRVSEAAAANTPAPAESNEADLPDWLRNFEVDGTNDPGSKEEIPDWLKSIQQSEQELQSPGVVPEVQQPEVSSASDQPVVDSEDAETEEPNPAGEPAPQAAELPEDHEIPPAEEPVAPQNHGHSEENGLPSWVRSVIEKTPTTNQLDEDEVETAESPEAVVPAENTGNEQGSGAALSEENGDDLLSWLRDLKPEEEAPTIEPANEEMSETASQSDLSAFDDGSSLDRLQELTGLMPDAIHEEEKPSETSEEATDSLIPEAGEKAETIPAEESVSESPAISEMPTPEADNLTATLTELSQALKSDQPAEQTIKKLSELSRAHGDHYLVWQLLGDAYAKSNDFKNALRSYNKAEEVILKPQ